MKIIKYFFLIVPFIAMLWVSSYSTDTPEVWGIPFFYWYQFLWVVISALLTAIVYFMDSKKERDAK
ncbi:MAG: DUF3311 domain-containing protein [Tumebacillaceae bacterium]